MWASEDEQKESLQWFHMTFWMLDVDLTDSHKKWTLECHIRKRVEVSLIRPVKVASKMLNETITVSLFTRLPMPLLLAAHGITALTLCSQSHSDAYLF